MKAAFIGLGTMGFPMAGNLSKAGHTVIVFNRTGNKADAWVKTYGGAKADSPGQAAHGADVVCTCVVADDDVRDVVYGKNGALSGMKQAAILIDHTTASAELARELDTAARERGIHFLDAPITGGRPGAEAGTLAVMVGGDAAVFDRAKPLISAYAGAVTLMGPAGAGQLTKMANQICSAGLVQSLAESLNFAQRAGLDVALLLEVMCKGAARSWIMENRADALLDDRLEFGFAVDWMRKDLRICLAEAGRNGAPLPVTALMSQIYDKISEQGGGRSDISSLMQQLRK